MLEVWKLCDYGDALHLLSSYYCCNDLYQKRHQKVKPEHARKIRQYAVSILEKTPVSQISDILL